MQQLFLDNLLLHSITMLQHFSLKVNAVVHFSIMERFLNKYTKILSRNLTLISRFISYNAT